MKTSKTLESHSNYDFYSQNEPWRRGWGGVGCSFESTYSKQSPTLPSWWATWLWTVQEPFLRQCPAGLTCCRNNTISEDPTFHGSTLFTANWPVSLKVYRYLTILPPRTEDILPYSSGPAIDRISEPLLLPKLEQIIISLLLPLAPSKHLPLFSFPWWAIP